MKNIISIFNKLNFLKLFLFLLNLILEWLLLQNGILRIFKQFSSKIKTEKPSLQLLEYWSIMFIRYFVQRFWMSRPWMEYSREKIKGSIKSLRFLIKEFWQFVTLQNCILYKFVFYEIIQKDGSPNKAKSIPRLLTI